MEQGTRLSPGWAAALLAFLLMPAAWYVDRLNTERHRADIRATTQSQLAAVRDRLEGNLYADLQTLKGLTALVRLEPGIDQARLDEVAPPLLAGRSQLRSVATAPGLVINAEFPLAGNEAAIGLDLGADPDQRDAALQAVRSRGLVVAGPLELVQGGEGLVARQPVFLGIDGEERLWGLVLGVIDTAQLYRGSGLLADDLAIDVAIRGRDGKGRGGEVFFGSPGVFDSAPVTADIALPVGSWRLAALPRDGWPTAADNAAVLRTALAGFAFLILAAFHLVLGSRQQAAAARVLAENSRRRLLDTLESVPNVAVQWIGADGRLCYWNRASERLYGWSAQEALGQARETLVPMAQGPPGLGDYLQRVVRDGERLGPIEYATRNRRGEPRWVQGSFFPLPASSDGEDDCPACVCVDVDITERKQTQAELLAYRDRLEDLVEERTRELGEAKEAAETASVAKSAFLANMSHEIRTPLNVITGMAYLIRRAGVTTEQAERLDKLERAGAHLLSVLNAVLDLSKIEAGKFELASRSVDPAEVARNVGQMLHDEARAKGLDLVLDVPSLPGRLAGDPTRLRQALLNYAANAVKFTRSGSVVIRVRAEQETREAVLVRFEVEDTGPGIEGDTLRALFRPFRQADETTTRRHGGTGLGLVITRKIAELMGGTAGAESVPGRGSLFWFTVRLARSSEEGRTRAVADDARPDTRLAREFPARRVLVVEDDADNQEVAAALLMAAGQHVTIAPNGHAAVEALRSGCYDLVLMDVQMPGMDGLEATRRIREMTAGKELPIVAMTANAFGDDRDRCAEAGMDDFLPKPVEAEALYRVVLEWYSRPVA